MRRILMLVTVALVMAAMMVLSAAGAFASPTDPYHHGQRVSAVAKSFPTDPTRGRDHGQTVSAVARGETTGCEVNQDFCPQP